MTPLMTHDREVDRKKVFAIDEFGIKSHGDMLASPVLALEPGFVDFARLQAGSCFGREAMESARPAIGKITALKRTHMFILTAADYQNAVKEIHKH